MKYLLANRIFMFFPVEFVFNYLVALWVCVTASVHVLRGHGTKSKDVPSRGMLK